MWRTLKIVMLLWPIPFMLFFIGTNAIDKAAVDKKLMDPNTIIWNTASGQIRFHVSMTSAGEEDTYLITLTDKNGQTIFREEFVNNRDMRGGGFVKGVQADGDPELELLVWGPNEWRTSYLLDYPNGQINKIGLDQFSPEVLRITREWHQAHVDDGLTIVLLGIGCAVYYLLILTIWFISKGVKCFKNRGQRGRR